MTMDDPIVTSTTEPNEKVNNPSTVTPSNPGEIIPMETGDEVVPTPTPTPTPTPQGGADADSPTTTAAATSCDTAASALIAIATSAAAVPTTAETRADTNASTANSSDVGESTPMEMAGDDTKKVDDGAAAATSCTTSTATVASTTSVPPTTTTTTTTDKPLSNTMSLKYAPRHADEESDDEQTTKTTKAAPTTTDDAEDMETNGFSKGVGGDDTTPSGDASSLPQCTTIVTLNNPTTTKNNNNNRRTSTTTQHNYETERTETSWEKVLLDAEEFESLMFSIRRPTARNRLQMLVKQMKQLSAKLKRHHEVMYVLRATALAKSELAGTKRKARELLVDGGSGGGVTNGQERQVVADRSISADGVGSSTQDGGVATDATGTGNKRIKLTNGKDSTTADGVDIPLFAMDRTARPNAALGTTSSGTPILKEKDKFVHHHRFGSNLHCPDYDATGECPLGAICHHLHVYRPPATTESSTTGGTNTSPSRSKYRKTYTRDDLKRAYETQRKITLTRTEFGEKIKADALNVPKYTLGFTCPIDKTIYYAQPFPADSIHNALTQYGGGLKSNQGIWWYRNMKEASEALATIVLEDLIRRNIVTDRFQPERVASGDAEVLMRKKNAAARAAILARTASVDNTPVLKTTRIAPVELPQIHPWNWMEVHYEARCNAFHGVGGCQRGHGCRNAHVFYPTPKAVGFQKGARGDGLRFPDLGAMPRAYYANFGMVLDDPFFHGQGYTDMPRGSGGGNGSHLIVQGRGISSFRTKSAVDARSQIWYTAAWKCPREGTIYYAAGGNSGRVNNQNMFLYPSVEQAKLAACGVVLDGFLDRGMAGNWNIPEQFPPGGRLSLSPNNGGGRVPLSNPGWLNGKPDNRALIPQQQWQQTLDYPVARQPQMRGGNGRSPRYVKTGMDPRLLQSGVPPMDGGAVTGHLVQQQTRQQGTVRQVGMNSYPGGLTGDDQGLEEELFG